MKNVAVAGWLASAAAMAMSAVVSTPAVAQDVGKADRQPANPSPDVIVTASGRYADGSSPDSGGAYVPTPSVGPFGDQDDRDTPFSVLSIPQLIIQDQQAHTAADLLRNDPSVIAFEPAVGRAQSFTVRGFGVGPAYGFYKDGLDLLSYTDPAIEATERVDVLKGAAAVAYGFAEPGGVVQFASKLPLDTSFARLRAGFISDGAGTAQADVGARLGAFGVRANGYYQDGDVGIDGSSRKRNVEALSLDVKPLDGLRFWLNGEHNRTAQRAGNSALFYSGVYSVIPTAPDPTTLLGQRWSFASIDSLTGEGGVDYTGGGWVVHAAAGFTHANNEFLGFFDSPTLQQNGSFGVSPLRGNFDYYNAAYRASLAKTLIFGSVSNTLTLVADGSRHSQHIAQALGASLGLSNLYAPVYFAQPTIVVPTETSRLINRLDAQIVTDKLDIGPVTLLGGAVRSGIETTSEQRPSGTVVSDLKQSKVTPLAAILVHPVERVTLYGSYLQALQPGQTAPSVGVTNPLEVLPPFTGSQYEVGAKIQALTGLELKGALFQVEEANAVINPQGRFAADGTQRNRGLEMTATGKLFPALTVFGGVTMLTARVNTDNGAGYATKAQHTPELRANMYAELAIPGLRGLTLVGGVFYVSEQIAARNTAANVALGRPFNVLLPSYTTGDVGFRYNWTGFRLPLSVSVYASNVGNAGYWVNSGTTVVLGDPRSVRVTLGTSF